MTQTLFLDGDKPRTITQVATLLQAGELVAFPTDTVYGIGCDPWNVDAIMRLYAAKERDTTKGIPILLADIPDLHKVCAAIPKNAAALIHHYWPGPLTIVVPRHPFLPDLLSPNENIAVRLPAHTIARQIIRRAGGAIATTSANRSGEPPALTGKMAWDALSGRVAAIVNGYHAYHAAASTIIDCTTDPVTIVRLGPITEQEIRSSLAQS
ncbi:MAG: threonylcarbamoyl-AMP synthase [Chloroflexi bacterium]|nr:threonylcarbamoyl-AMP synthase [Chloroflexota bacterium]MBP8060189.1 threonylcarbamoyl-AMP synthase [Chloroflexota bacterium]